MVNFMVNCNICNKVCKNNKGISYHFKTVHNLDYIQYLVENKLIEIPKCLECGNDINVLSGRGRVKILNHPEELLYCSNECKLKNTEYRNKMSICGIKGGKMTLGRIVTDETKHKLSESQIERFSDIKERKKISNSLIGVKKSEKHKKNISKSKKGIIFSEEHKNNLSKSITNSYINGKSFGSKIKYNSIKCNKIINLMSTYEFKFSVYLDMNSDVIKWKYQPFALFDKKLKKRYIPDFYVEFKNGDVWLVEIDRYKGFKEKHGYKWKIVLAQKYCDDNNITYKYMDLSDIHVLFSNKFKELDISDIQLNKQINVYSETISKNLIELFSTSDKKTIQFNTNNIIKTDFVNPTLPSIKINNINYRKFKTQNMVILKNIYDNYWRCKWNVSRFSPLEALNYNVTFKTLLSNLIKYNKPINGITILQQLNREKYGISFFSDAWAKWIYKKFINKYTKTIKILDISGGFGGRILGFYHLIDEYSIQDYTYDYVDINRETCNNTKKLVNILEMNVNIINSKFETSSVFNNHYNLMLTSIPYYDLEIYNNIKLNEIYTSKSTFITEYINNIFKLNCDTLIINVSEKFRNLFFNNIVNFNGYKLDKNINIIIDNSFLKNKMKTKHENFLIFKKSYNTK